MANELHATLFVETDDDGLPGTGFTGSIEPGEATLVLLQATVIVLPSGGHDTVTIDVEHGADNGMFSAVGDRVEIMDTDPHIARIEGVIGGFVRLKVTLSSDAGFRVGAVVEVALTPAPKAVAVPKPFEPRGLSLAFQLAAQASQGRIRVVPER